MNNIILSYFERILRESSGNYFEVGADDGAMVSVLSEYFPEKTLISLDNHVENFETIFSRVSEKTNLLFYAMSPKDYNQTLTDKIADSYNIVIVYINSGIDYQDYAESVKLAVRLLGTAAGYVVFNHSHDSEMQMAINEFKFQIGHRITAEENIVDQHVSFTVREQ